MSCACLALSLPAVLHAATTTHRHTHTHTDRHTGIDRLVYEQADGRADGPTDSSRHIIHATAIRPRFDCSTTYEKNEFRFYRQSSCLDAQSTILLWQIRLSVCASVCPSLRHTLVSDRNECTFRHLNLSSI